MQCTMDASCDLTGTLTTKHFSAGSWYTAGPLCLPALTGSMFSTPLHLATQLATTSLQANKDLAMVTSSE